MTSGREIVVFARQDIPGEYVDRMRQMGVRCAIEPWDFTEPEPVPAADLSACEVILTTGLFDPLRILQKAPRVRWVHSISVGIDAFRRENLQLRELTVTNSKGCNSIPVAEHAIALMMALARGIPSIVRNQTARTWKAEPVKELHGSTVGLVGFGEIGMETARRCNSLGMRVLACRKNPDKSAGQPALADAVFGLDRLEDMLPQIDYLILALPLTDETRHLMDRRKFARLQTGCYLINVGRGDVVHEPALLESLSSGRLAGAALDVFETEPLPPHHPLWEFENVIVSPHRAYDSPRNPKRQMELFLHNLRCYLEGKPLRNVVDVHQGY